ncbi:hypothetical protein GCM10028808_17190 [Spirosoma migulaei]
MATSKREAEKKAREIVNKWSAGATAVSWIPGSSLALGFADFGMIRSVAQAFEVTDFNEEAVVASLGAGAAGRGAAEWLSFIPGPGWIAKAVIAGGITKGLGEAVINYMKDRTPLY